MYTTRLLLQPEHSNDLDPTVGASRVGAREIAGDVPSTGERVTLLCWAVVFDEVSVASDHYRVIVSQLAEVDGNGLATTRLPRFDADRFGNMSERTDTLGEVATLWVTGTSDGGDKRGAILLARDGFLIQMLALTQYAAVGTDRAPYLIERMAGAMAARQAEIEMEPWAATMSYLPLVDDVNGSLQNASVTYNRYGVPSSG